MGQVKRFIANLSAYEICDQIKSILHDEIPEGRFQIMFMSMGEPLLNWDSVSKAIKGLHVWYPTAELLISTIAPRAIYTESIIALSRAIPNIGLQFSIHKATDEQRNSLIPYKNKLSLDEIAWFGKNWHKATGRMPYCNYCIDGTNNTEEDAERLFSLFPPDVFALPSPSFAALMKP